MYSLSRRRLLDTPKVILLALTFTLISGALFYIIFSFEFMQLPAFFHASKPDKKLYIIHSKENERYLLQARYNVDAYQNNLLRLQNELRTLGFESELIEINQIPFLKPNNLLIAPDLYALSNESFEDIKSFLKNGGRLLFNYHFGYFTPEGAFMGAKRIEELTGLRYLDHLDHNASEATFIIPRILSPLGAARSDPVRSDLIRYDPIPLFRSKTLPDAVLTNWQVTLPPKVHDRLLETREAGVMWHGRYGNGAWYFASFPMYGFFEMKKPQKERYLKGALDFLHRGMEVVVYPFLQVKKAVFISEDTEYKYPQLLAFAQLTYHYKIPTTLFCVASLAQKYPSITKEAASLPNVEIASHSYSHTSLEEVDDTGLVRETAYAKELLEEISGQEVIGFRPPKEEIDKRAKKALIEAGYRYVMERTKPHLLPFLDEDLVILPRHGTDDYIYLINLDWTQDQIYEQIIKETSFLGDVNALYTLSIHTHLIAYGPNIHILKRYFDYLTRNKEYTPLNGRQLNTIARAKARIDLELQKNPKSIILTIYNHNKERIERPRFRIYFATPTDIERVYSEIINIKARIIAKKEDYIDVEVDQLYPKATLSLILPYSSR